jgi:dTDP-4-dehydrorhamnose reductase
LLEPESFSGIYHVADKGQVSRYDFARNIVQLDPRKYEQQVKEITPVRSDAFPTAAKRPSNSALDCTKFETTFDIALPEWAEGLKNYMDQRNG